jgi:hypothetical protein
MPSWGPDLVDRMILFDFGISNFNIKIKGYSYISKNKTFFL